MNLPTHLSPQAALARLDVVYANELASAAEGLALIALVDARKDYLAAGYSCMKSYCTGNLKMTDDVAAKRIQAARTAGRFPRIFELVAKGRLTVSAVVVLSAHLRDDNSDELLEMAAGRSRSEIQFLLDTRSRRQEPALSFACGEIPAISEDAPGHPAFAGVFANSVTRDHSEHAPGHPAPAAARRGRLAPSTEGACEVRLTLTPEERDVLQQVQALASHTEWGSDPALVYARAMELLAEHLLAQKLGKGNGDAATSVGNGRRIPKAIKFAVWKRDGGSCSFVGPDGHRCGEPSYVDFDHIVPVALGGTSTLENVRLLCRPHNQYEAERVLGREHVRTRRELAQRERARVKAAAKAEKERAAVLAKAKKARLDELVPGLRRLGFSMEDATNAAEACERIPQASLEERMKLALRSLTGHIGRHEDFRPISPGAEAPDCHPCPPMH